ncbi:Hypothetical predicted protein [Paramuricea clavata]|uniref:Uncharacterized protein n=1 Tax=Paramuricea clavata TaxID=317549 RepID=A0A6S7HVM9_PARCT|nr:Hypothetical predicted protein [Paramuricea clavata]
MDPKISIPQGAQNGVQPFAANSTEMGHASTTHVDTATPATDAQVLTQDINAVKDPQAIATMPQRVVTNPANQSISKIILSLPTPISVDNLEVALTGHPDTHFTSQICNILRSAPFIFNQLSDAVEWILRNNCKISFACHILDDFLIMEPKAPSIPHDSTCLQSLSKMLLTFHDLKIPIAPGKTQGPLQVLEFMGIILDTVKMEARLPADKIHRIRTIFAEFEAKKSCTLKELQSLIGTLNFACKVVPPGRPFLQRMIDLTRNVKESHHHIKLNLGFFKDLAMWKQFITNWNGANFFLSTLWQDADSLQLFTDASGTLGYGGIFGELTCNTKFNPEVHLMLENLYFAPGVGQGNPEFMTVEIKVSKTDPFCLGQTITVGASNSPLCPVLAMKKYLLFIFNDSIFGSLITSLKHKNGLVYLFHCMLRLLATNEKMLPYMHAMVYHVPNFLQMFKSVKLFTGQGVEKNNDAARSTVLRKSNKWDSPADVLKHQARLWELHT